MGYYKIKSISLKPKEKKIILCGASNNVTPITYYTNNIVGENEDYHNAELDLMRAINGGGYVLNNSCYKWEYARMKTNEEIYNDKNTWQIYDDTKKNYQLYYRGNVSWAKDYCYIELTDTQLASGEYKVEWEDKKGNGKTYYNINEYNTKQQKVMTILENYYNVFMKYFNEKRDGEYYLCSDTYGYVEPKGTNGAFYYNCSTIKTMDYKKAYCLSNLISKDISIKKEMKKCDS
ncbi:MAG: hypothetical protein RR478_05535 [Bacilli bacterium]